MHYYNECDPKAAAWLRELIRVGVIPAGDVDERDIRKVVAGDLRAYRSAHFFAGIGGWAEALRLAGWPDEWPVWTGSCPCPPFSKAGRKARCPQCGGKPMPHPYQTGVFACIPCGHEWYADGRHLWPEFRRLIAECNPPIVFGEQVAGRDGLVWLAGMRATLEVLGYAVGSADLCAAGVGAPHVRQRLFWVADRRTDPVELGDANGGGCPEGQAVSRCAAAGAGVPSPLDFWGQYAVANFRDGKARRFESRSFPLVDGLPGRVAALRGYGNAIVPQVGAGFVKAYRAARGI